MLNPEKASTKSSTSHSETTLIPRYMFNDIVPCLVEQKDIIKIHGWLLDCETFIHVLHFNISAFLSIYKFIHNLSTS